MILLVLSSITIVNGWYKSCKNNRPIEILQESIADALTMGFIAATAYDDYKFDGKGLGSWLWAMYGDVREGFYSDVLSKNRELEKFYNAMDVDVSVLLGSCIEDVISVGMRISPALLHKIEHTAMKALFHIGFSYGMKYWKHSEYLKCVLPLFSEEEMEGSHFFIGFEKAYLEAMRIVSKLDVVSFAILSHHYEQSYPLCLKSLPEYEMDLARHKALGDIIGMRHLYYNHGATVKPHVTVPDSFVKAREGFKSECNNQEYISTEWLTPLSLQELICTQ